MMMIMMMIVMIIFMWLSPSHAFIIRQASVPNIRIQQQQQQQQQRHPTSHKSRKSSSLVHHHIPWPSNVRWQGGNTVLCAEKERNVDVDIYSPHVTGGCVKDIANHIRLLDKSLEQTSGKGIFRRINDILWQEAATANSVSKDDQTIVNITSAEHLDVNERFGILSHGIQDDPIYNYGNRAALQLFDQTIDNLCQIPSRYSTVESLVEDRERLIQQIRTVGCGIIPNAIRITTKGKLFVIPTVWIWNVYHDDDNRRIGLAALFDCDTVLDYTGPPIVQATR